jgi:hypothetical protein
MHMVTTPPELDIQVPLAAIEAFAAAGRVYRAFDHAIAADKGMVLLVPIWRVCGDLGGLEDACPVPWEEVIGILEEPKADARPVPEWAMSISGRTFRSLARTHWDADEISIGPGFATPVTRFFHPAGIHLAVLSALLPNHGDLWRAN